MNQNNFMQQYINEQPKILRKILEDREEIVSPFVQKMRNIDFDRIVLVGSGSSFNAGLMAKPLIEKIFKIEVNATIPTRIADLVNISAKNVLYFALSQGGRSTNTNEVIQNIHQTGKTIIAITEFPDSPITKQVDLSILLPIGEETIGAKTKGVTATTLILMLSCLELGYAQGHVSKIQYDKLVEDMYHVLEYMEENIRRSLIWTQSITPMMNSMNSFILIAKGNELGTAKEGSLKLLETIWKPVTSYEFEEYLHGPENAFDNKTSAIILISDDQDRERMHLLSNFANSCGSHFFIIDRIGAQTESEQLNLLTTENEYLTCFAYLPALQSLCAQLSADYGIDLKQSKYPDFQNLMATKLK
jgi:glucoselysine-6-phosphate deglycase